MSLLEVKRTNNVEIALSRLRMSDAQLVAAREAAVLDAPAGSGDAGAFGDWRRWSLSFHEARGRVRGDLCVV